jgi:MoaA/NifB/PqqE/SkfB family radical SAM enzyme
MNMAPRSSPGPTSALRGPDAVAHVERRLLLPLDRLLTFPRYFLIETINSCNARCVMCGIDFDSKTKQIIDDALFDRMVAEIGQHADFVEKVMLYLDGEPLLDKRMPDKVAKMKAAGVKKVNLATNASLLDERRGRALIAAGLDEVYITLDSLDPATYEAIRVRLKFDEVYANIMTFIALRDQLNPKLLIRIQMIQQDLNFDEGDAFLAHWRTRLSPIDQIVVQRAHNWANGVAVHKFGDEADINAVPCIALWGTFVVHVDGTVPLCCMDTDTHHRLGDLRTQSIAEVWRGQVLDRIRALHLDGRRAEIAMCDGCTLWRETKHAADEGPQS